MNLMQHMAKKGYQGLGLISAIPWTWPIAESRCLRSGQKIQHYLLPSSLISIGYFPCVLDISPVQASAAGKGSEVVVNSSLLWVHGKQTTLSWEGRDHSTLSPLLFPPFSGIQGWLSEKTAAQDQGTGSQRSLSNRCSRGTMLASYQQYSRGKSPCSCAWWLIL